jgi:hypothetical protein
MSNSDDINNAILTGIVKTLEIFKDVREQGDDLNDIDFDEIIEVRLRDMTDLSIYNATKDRDVDTEQI